MSVREEVARRQWEEGHRRLLDEARDPLQADRLHDALEAVTAELRRRLGQTFTVAELTREYERADDWAREAVAATARASGWVRTVSIAQDAAFHLYQRGATDYRP
jgi:hypothetical protein